MGVCPAETCGKPAPSAMCAATDRQRAHVDPLVVPQNPGIHQIPVRRTRQQIQRVRPFGHRSAHAVAGVQSNHRPRTRP